MKKIYNWDSLPVLLTVHDVAIILGVGDATVYRNARQGIIPSVKVGRLIRFEKNILRGWLCDLR